MTREEEIRQQAAWEARSNIIGYPTEDVKEAFIKGAQYADKHPVFYFGQTDEMMEHEAAFANAWHKEHKGERPTYADAIAWAERETIYKACEWLRMNMADTIYMSTHGLQDLSKVDFINKFYEAMKGE